MLTNTQRINQIIFLRLLIRWVAMVTAACEFGVELADAARATGPLRVHPLNPRYFTDGSGRAIYLTGSHTWANLQDRGFSKPPPTFDYTAYLDWMQTYNHNFMRMWAWEQAAWAPWTKKSYYFEPLPYKRTGPGTALDGGPKFDLGQFNQAYFDRLRSRVVEAGDRGIYVSIMPFQGWSLEMKKQKGANPWEGHPFNIKNNINGINGDPDGDGFGTEVHTLSVPAVTALQEIYIRKVIDTVNDLDNVLYEIANESHGGSDLWGNHLIDYIHAYEASKPKQHPVLYSEAWDFSGSEIWASRAEAVSPGSGGKTGGFKPYRDDPPANGGSKVIINDTDHLWGLGGDHSWVWKSFLRGLHPIFMDPYDGVPNNPPPFDPQWDLLRWNMGYTLTYAKKTNLVSMVPHGDLASTGYCLANSGLEYLIYLPGGGKVWVDLSAASGTFSVEWFNPITGATTSGGKIAGGANRAFTPPFTRWHNLLSQRWPQRLGFSLSSVQLLFRPIFHLDAVLYLAASSASPKEDARGTGASLVRPMALGLHP
jgi:hypothetical protein